MRYVGVLTIAGSDPSGGAGIQADLKTMQALGCYGSSALTAVTVQNTLGVEAIHAVPAEVVEGQIRAVMDDIRPEAIKIGMTGDGATIRAICRALKPYKEACPGLPIVVDPVMVSTSGAPLMAKDALGSLKNELLPMATLLTPNLPEAEALAGMALNGDEASWMDQAGRLIALTTGSAVLIKGGHSMGDKTDRLYAPDGKRLMELRGETIETRNTHGTGCSLSAAIASLLARGMKMEEAVSGAKEWLTEALRAGADVEIGGGHGPVCHGFRPEPTIKL